ncbi:MAG TPA: hypothetical protein VJ179_00780 [Patescibacteria group bacterium]|nr:hypothetical protein [Patescibacteria group bacterium]
MPEEVNKTQQQPVEQPTPQPTPEPTPQPISERVEEVPKADPQAGHPRQSKQPLLMLTGLLVLLLLGAVAFYLYKQSMYQPPAETPEQEEQVNLRDAVNEAGLKVQNVSGATDLPTIEKEITQTEVASPEADIDALDEKASGL